MDQRKEKKNVHIPKPPFSILIRYSKQPNSLSSTILSFWHLKMLSMENLQGINIYWNI